MKTPKHTLSISVLKKALTKEQFNKLMKLYEQAKNGNGKGITRGRRGWTPTKADWKRYRDNDTNIERWQEVWDIGKEACLRRLGKMKLMGGEDEGVSSFLGIKF